LPQSLRLILSPAAAPVRHVKQASSKPPPATAWSRPYAPHAMPTPQTVRPSHPLGSRRVLAMQASMESLQTTRSHAQLAVPASSRPLPATARSRPDALSVPMGTPLLRVQPQERRLKVIVAYAQLAILMPVWVLQRVFRVYFWEVLSSWCCHLH